MRWRSLLIAVVFVLGAARAEALTVRDIIELSKSGLSDEILMALIDVERKVFPIDSATLKQLKEAGVSDRVIVAMVRSGRVSPAPTPATEPNPTALSERGAAARVEAPPPHVVVIEHRESEPVRQIRQVHEVMVPVPVYVPVVTHPRRRGDDVVHQPVVTTPPFSTIGLPQSHFGLSPAPPKPTSDPPYWHEMQRPPRKQ